MAVVLQVEIIANDQGNRTTPSYVAFTADERLIGEAAKNQAAMNPTNTVFDAKRLIGRNFSDKTVQDDMKVSAVTTQRAEGNCCALQVLTVRSLCARSPAVAVQGRQRRRQAHH